MAESREESAGVWKVGMLLEASYLAQLRSHPMKLLKPTVTDESSAGCGVVALCKQGLLKTYHYVNEYNTPSSSGCQLHAVDDCACKFPAVLAAPMANQHLDFDELFQQLNVSMEDLHVVTGLQQPSEPTIILASQHFMECYGFFTREPIWFRWYTPSVLSHVMLSPIGPFASQAMAEACQISTQLYAKAEKEPVIMQRNFKFVLRTSLNFAGAENVVLSFQVVDCSPVLQGKVTADTIITLLPPTAVSSYVTRLGRRRRSTREEGKGGGHAESAASASTLLSSGEQQSEMEGYVIEAVVAASFKLQSQYIVLPKETAKKHGIFHCQNVLIEAVQEPGGKAAASSLSEVTVSLCITDGCDELLERRSRMAIALLYEDEFELERYIPPTTLGLDYDTTSLTLAYIHPQLHFFLFPETLSLTVHYFIKVKRSRETLPSVKMIQLALVSTPENLSQDTTVIERLDQNHPIYEFFDQRSVLLNVGEVFKVCFDAGSVHDYKVCSLDPNCHGAATVDAQFSWECFLKPRKTHSYISDIVPPSVLGQETPFFSSIAPPGLQQYANTLFSFFLPAFRAVSGTQPHRSPSVLITGLPGVGKKTLVKAVARRCRMHVVEFNCYEFTSDSVPSAEKKMTSDLNAGTFCDPVVIILSNVHMLGRKNILQEEPRMTAMFEVYMSTVNNFNATNNFPILIVGVTSNPNQVPSRVQSCFLHQLEVLPPTQSQRLDMLTSLSKQYHLGLTVNLTVITQATAGYVLGDLVNLLTQAFDLAVKSTYSHYCSKSKACSSQDLAISGVIVTQTHLEAALGNLQAMHSDSIGAPKIPNVKWEDVGGLAEAKKEILDTIQIPLLYPDLFGSGLRRSGILLYGAPGTGKTLLAKAVATECSLNFLSVKGPELITMYVGQSEENIREVFSRARRSSPSVIFFDELDSIAPNRGRSGDSGGVMDRVVSQLLAELDGLHKATDVFIIGATNRPDLIDPALLRPGRLDRLVYLGVNDNTDARKKILQAITRRFQLAADVDLGAIAESCPSNLTGADLYSLCSDAMLTALRRKISVLEIGHADQNELVVEQSDLLSALHSLTPSITPTELAEYKNINTKMTAS